MTRRYDGDIPGWGGLAQQRPADPRRLRRRRSLRRVHLQRRRLVDALPRHVPVRRHRAGLCPPLRRRRARLGRPGPARPVLRRRHRRRRAHATCGRGTTTDWSTGVPGPDDLLGHRALGDLRRATGWESGTSARPMPSRSARFSGQTGQPQPVRAQHRLVRVINGRRGLSARPHLLPVDPHLPLRPELVRGTDDERKTKRGHALPEWTSAARVSP